MNKKAIGFFFLTIDVLLLLCMEKSGDALHEIYNRYHSDPIRTKSRDDFLHNVRMQRSLFMQLYVQAATPSYMPYIERPGCLSRLHKITIKGDVSHPGYLVMTEKDLFYRLLTMIPRGDTYSLINKKRVRLSLQYYPIDAETQGIILLADYSFEEDRKHHQKIVQKFNELRLTLI